MTKTIDLTRISRLCAIATACLALALDANASGKEKAGHIDDKLAAVIADRGASTQRVIVRTRDDAPSAIRQSIKGHGGKIIATHGSTHEFTAFVPSQDLAALSRQDGVLSISSDAIVGSQGGPRDTAAASGPGVTPAMLRQTLGLSDKWDGKDVGIAVIDSGLEMSAEFEGRIAAFYDFTTGEAIATSPSDPYGHGTHVAGTIAATGAGTKDHANRGIAPRARLVILRVLDENGAGYTSDVIRAIDFAVDNRARLGIDVINLSLGHPIYEPAASDPMVQAVERASRAGIVVVAAAGNFGVNPATARPGYAGVTSPGNAPSAITVGALRTGTTVSRGDDRIPDYSSAGPTWYDGMVKPDLLAPGHNIVAVAATHGFLYAAYPQLREAGPNSMRLSGTSMATAVATGVIALALEAHDHEANKKAPALTPNTIKGVLEYTSFAVQDDQGADYDVLRQGAGGLNGSGAIEMARSIDTKAAPGTPWLKPYPAPATTIGGETVAWQQAVIWGNSMAWGNTVPVNLQAWGANITWGSNITWADSIIWSSNITWAESITWSEAIVWSSDAIGTTYGDAVIWGSSADLTQETAAWKPLP